MIKGIHHVALITPDLERILRFYRDALGFKEVVRGGWRTTDERAATYDTIVDLKGGAANVAMVHGGNLIIEIFEYLSPTAEAPAGKSEANMRGWRHISLDVTDIDDVFEKIKTAGGDFPNPPQDLGYVKAVYGRDPDGNLIELQELFGENNPMELKISALSPAI